MNVTILSNLVNDPNSLLQVLEPSSGHKIEMPISEVVYSIIYKDLPPGKDLKMLLSRE